MTKKQEEAFNAAGKLKPLISCRFEGSRLK
jgi:hypothetical protein